jgi:hypothetical protein
LVENSVRRPEGFLRGYTQYAIYLSPAPPPWFTLGLLDTKLHVSASMRFYGGRKWARRHTAQESRGLEEAAEDL